MSTMLAKRLQQNCLGSSGPRAVDNSKWSGVS